MPLRYQSRLLGIVQPVGLAADTPKIKRQVTVKERGSILQPRKTSSMTNISVSKLNLNSRKQRGEEETKYDIDLWQTKN